VGFDQRSLDLWSWRGEPDTGTFPMAEPHGRVPLKAPTRARMPDSQLARADGDLSPAVATAKAMDPTIRPSDGRRDDDQPSEARTGNRRWPRGHRHFTEQSNQARVMAGPFRREQK
jgi:hypothetical protein